MADGRDDKFVILASGSGRGRNRTVRPSPTSEDATLNTRPLIAAAAVLCLSAPAFATHVLVPTTDERGYSTRWDSSVQAKTRAQVKNDMAAAQKQHAQAVRLGVFPTPKSIKVADRATVRSDAYKTVRMPVGEQYRPN